MLSSTSCHWTIPQKRPGAEWCGHQQISPKSTLQVLWYHTYSKLHPKSLPYPGSRFSTHLPNELFFQKNLVRHMLIFGNIFQIFFIFNEKNLFLEKINFPKISALLFWNYFMPNLLLGNGIWCAITLELLKTLAFDLIQKFLP